MANLIAFLESGAVYESVLAGAPPGFSFLDTLKSAKEIRIGVAFGRMSGWQKIASALTGSTAERVFVLLGQAFFQTEPSLVLELRKLAKASAKPIFQVKLASATVTFHPKVWIIDGSQSAAIVGSGNLTGGGLADNVECGLYSAVEDHVKGLREWFDDQWKSAPPLEESCDKYIKSYQKIQGHTKLARAMIDDEIRILSGGEVKWRRNDALLKAKQYWMSPDGKQTVADRATGIAEMRRALDYPSFEFQEAGWKAFLDVHEMGHIIPTHTKKVIAGLSPLRQTLKTVVLPGVSAGRAVESLQDIPGVGRNVATKLLAMIAPERFVVVNEPVERALRGFGYSIDSGSHITGKQYTQLLKDLKPFIEECEELGLQPAPGLDAFLYAYKDL